MTFEVSGNWDVTEVTKTNVSDFTTLPQAADFTITITDASSAQVWTGNVSEWDPATTLVAGTYTVAASYGSVNEEGFNKPCFLGTQEFTVVGGETTSVNVSVSLANTIIKIATSQYFDRYYTDYTLKFTRDGNDVVTFTKGETRAAFVDGYKITLEGTLTSETRTQTFTQEYTNLLEATAYTLSLDVANVGGSTLTITFNDTLETVELEDYELND